MRSFAGKVAVVTGAGGNGIGNELARELVARGARVAICDVAGLGKTERELTQLQGDFHSEHVDMSRKAEIDTFVEHVLERFGHVDLLINNAGIPLGDRTFEEVTPADFERITDVNYWGVVHTTQRLYRHLLSRPEAAIVNISSAQGILGLPYLVPYCTTKFAVRGFTDALRAEHAVRGIDHVTVHTVHPGRVATDITLHADYQDAGSARFHADLQRGTSPQVAASLILRGVTRGTGRIFVNDGALQDLVARLLPTRNVHVIKAMMRLRGIAAR